ncbi:dipeptidase [Paenibacillus paeoniae]|uniref:Membrane dipeptidase n=1 Tax=Paenibacillus paeoniae TaxID=2292705 RepID=A0A371PK41_9BACL|nr:dipeptidase [Paenibacillus paeoniae]REK76581.1 membrane dipeptidase [Paenibacillus paeoniae]
MRIVDFHCDVLYKLLQDKELTFDGGNKPGVLDVTLERLKEGNVLLQTFAVFISPGRPDYYEAAPILESIDLFYEKVLCFPELRLIRTAADVDACILDGKIGALLSLEGVGGIRGKLSTLRLLQRLGVRAAGLTWNDANWAADGVMEARGGGLTAQGAAFVQECNRLGIIVDVSHLSERAFWDVAALSSRPIVASHSNARELCDHPRNLTDLQIRAIIESGGLIGITYVPPFVREKGDVSIDDVLRHIEHICALGGEKHLALGSDFDGIDRHVKGLAHPGQVLGLREALLKRYNDDIVRGILSSNAVTFLKGQLPVE